MIQDAKRRHIPIIATTTDISIGGQVLCAAIGCGVTIVGLAGGVLQALSGPLKHTLFSVACESHTDPAALAFVDATDTILCVEGDGALYAYEFAEPQFHGARVTQRVHTVGGAVSAVKACSYTPRFVAAARHVVSVFDLTRDESSGGHRIVPYAEVHVPFAVRTIAILADIVCYASKTEVWCAGIEPTRRDPVQPDEEIFKQNCPLSSGSTQGVLDEGYVEVKFRSSANCLAHQNPPRGGSGGYGSSAEYDVTDVILSYQRGGQAAGGGQAGGGRASQRQPSVHGHTQGGRVGKSKYGKDAKPQDEGTSVECVHRDGAQVPQGGWGAGRANRLAGATVPLSEHAVLFFTPHRRYTQYTAGRSKEDAACRLLFKARVDQACGGVHHVALLPSPATADAGCASVGGERVQGRLLYVAETRAWVASMAGAELCDYVFDPPVKRAFSNATYLFTISQHGVLDVYPLRTESPACAALQRSWMLCQRGGGMGGTKTPRDTPHRGTPTAPSSTGHHHAPFSHTVQRLQSVPLCCVPRAVACCDATVFLINPFAPPSSRARTGAADAKLLSQGPALPANRAVTVDCLPTLRASDRFTTRTPSACSSSAGSAKHLRYSSLGVNDFAGHKGGDGPSGTMCALATAAELVQELYREHQRGAVYDDTASLALLYEGYLLLAARTCHLRLAAALLPEGPASASVEAFSVQLDLQNTLLLQECVATVLGDMYFKLERGSDGPSHSHRGGRTRYHHSSRDFENASVRSGTSIDGQSEKDSYWSVYSSSYGEVGGMNVTDTAELYGGSNMPDPSAMGIMATSSGTSFVMDEAAGAGVLSGLGGGKGLWSWVFYASSDRSLRMAYTMLRRDHWALLSYLDCVLFSQSKPKVLATSAEAMPPLLSEEQGNALLALYSRYAPHKLCSVVWDSWLGRAKGGVACFTAGVAARLLLEACGKVSSASRRYSSSSRLTTTSAHTRSYDGSEVEERDTQENYGVNLWGCTPPREQFVIGLLLLEDGRVGGTVESWAAIDGTALTELASSSSHLWEPDVYPGDSTEELLCAILPDMEGASGGISEDALASSLHVVGAALEEPSSGASRTLTMGTLLALHFPWLLVPSLIAAREKFSIPITSCLRLLKCVPPRSSRGVSTS